MRIDKFLWFVRIYKTRTDATDAVKNNRVIIDDQTVKPSREVEVGDVFTVRKPPVIYTYRIKGFPKGRVGAKLVEDYLENLTPASEMEKLEYRTLAPNLKRERGTGRPTKKERRTLDQLLDSWDDDDFED